MILFQFFHSLYLKSHCNIHQKKREKNSYRLEIRRQVCFLLVKLHGWHTLCIPTHFASQHTLLPETIYSSAHFASQHTLLLSTLYSQEHFAPWNNLLHGTLCFKCSREQTMLRRKMYQWAKCSKEQNVPGSKVCWEARCSRKQGVLESRVFQGANSVKGQSVPGSKMCWGVTCSGEQSVCQPLHDRT